MNTNSLALQCLTAIMISSKNPRLNLASNLLLADAAILISKSAITGHILILLSNPFWLILILIMSMTIRMGYWWSKWLLMIFVTYSFFFGTYILNANFSESFILGCVMIVQYAITIAALVLALANTESD